MEDVDLGELGRNTPVGRMTPMAQMREEESRGLVAEGDGRRQLQVPSGDSMRETPDSFMARPYAWYDPALIPAEYNRT